jgi:nucleotide-binding universal stress UspA family protein
MTSPRKPRYLVATDGSAPSEKALTRAFELAKGAGAHLRIVTVEDIRLAHPEAVAASGLVLSHDVIGDGGREIAEAARSRAAGEGLEAEAVFVPLADPAAAIVRQAGEFHADLVIVGSHGLTGIARWMIGSVAEKVVRHAPCSVLVVR